jgi:urea transport system substrate-binding protein
MTTRRLILVVDDDPDLRELLTLALSSEEVDVECAENGRQALALLARRRPDLILLDMKMPVMDGWEFSRILDGRADRPPVVVVTAASNSAERAREVHAEGWLGKPFELDDVRATARRFLTP